MVRAWTPDHHFQQVGEQNGATKTQPQKMDRFFFAAGKQISRQ
jgi:hypothetical protein